MISSGNKPYFFEGPYPFSSSGNQRIGMSGILFEQAMFALIAEQDIYIAQTGNNRKFTKYINKDANITQTFEPRADGSSLAGRSIESNGSGGCVNFKNYITDLRTKFSGLFPLIQSDSPYSDVELLLDYFQRHTGDNPSGSIGNWVHGVDLIINGIYDIDLREVTYQPYTRVGKFQLSNISGIKLPVKPIGPMFMSRSGTLIATSDRDLSSASQVDGDSIFAYSAAQTDRLAVQGDILVPNTTKLYVAWNSGLLLDNTTGNCEQSAVRTMDAGADLAFMGSGVGFFSPPSINVGTGIYSIQLFNNSTTINNMYIPKSGIIGFWPKLSELVTSGYVRATLADGSNQQFTSGFHIFNTAFWQYSTSGAVLQSPINGAYLWYRYADNQAWSTSNYGPKRWKDLTSTPALPLIYPNDNLVFYVGQTADLNPDIILADIRFVFAKYNPSTLDFISAHENPYSIPAAESPPSVDKFFYIYNHNNLSGINFTGYYCISEITTLSSGPEIYILNANLDCVGAWDNNTRASAAPIGVINGHLYGFDPNQVSSSGATFYWDHNVFADPGGVFPMATSSAGVVDTSVTLYETRDTVFDNTTNIGQLFEPINPNNFSFGGTPYIIDPQGTDLDHGNGSVLVKFQAKMKGETVLKEFVGRIIEATIGANNVMMIYDFTPLKDGFPNWVSAIG